MGKLTVKVGSVVLVNFPFSDLRGQKIRPALVLAKAEFDNLILCQITSKPYSSGTSIKVQKSNFTTGELPVVSYVRPDKLFTTDKTITRGVAGQLKKPVTDKILKRVRQMFI